MREIKFRLIEKNKVVGCEWLDGGEWKHSLPEKNIICYGVFRGLKVNKTFIRVQFTGLLDKNGKEIYEGDIVRGSPWDEKVANFQIAWCNDMAEFRFEEIGGSQLCGFVNRNSKDVETIGNIHENPELLENNR